MRAVLARLPEPHVNLFAMLANAPALIGPPLRLGEAILTNGDLDVVVRGLAILPVARLTGTEYEWVQLKDEAPPPGGRDGCGVGARSRPDELTARS